MNREEQLEKLKMHIENIKKYKYIQDEICGELIENIAEALEIINNLLGNE